MQDPTVQAVRQAILALLPHGHPTTHQVALAFYLTRWPRLAKGYAVLRPNPRGSSGYGKGFRVANFNDWGGGDYADIMAGVNKVIEMGVAGDVPPGRLGVELVNGRPVDFDDIESHEAGQLLQPARQPHGRTDIGPKELVAVEVTMLVPAGPVGP